MKRSEIRDCFIVCQKPGLRCAPSGLRLLNKQGRGRAFKLTIKPNAQTKRLTKAIDKAAAGRKR